MRILPTLALVLGLHWLLAGCATVESHDTLALTGTVVDKHEVSATAGSAGAYRPGQGGAIGGAIAGLITAATSTSHFFVYTMKMRDGQTKDVNSPEDRQLGECPDVMVPKSKGSIGFIWAPEEVTLRPSSACAKAP